MAWFLVVGSVTPAFSASASQGVVVFCLVLGALAAPARLISETGPAFTRA